MVMFQMSDAHYETIYNVLSFSLASMMSTTLFLWLRMPAIVPKYKSAVLISGMVTFIAAYHYIRIFNSWVDAYEYPKANAGAEYPGFSAQAYPDPVLTGVPFNDAYRYMDWLLTVPLLLMEIVLTMSLPPEESSSKCWSLGIFSALMIVSGYRGELVIQGDLTTRWTHWFVSMCFFSYVVYTLLIGLADATNAEPDVKVKNMLKNAQVVTCVSWCTYPIVYLFPMIGIHGSRAVVAIQIGYCTSDVISKCLVGLMIYQITIYKSQAEMKLGR
jgi:bacteriorhodopsin